MMDYKGYTALLEVDVDSGMLVGHVIGIRDEIVFQGKTVEEARASFAQTVDFYLRSRAEAGQEPARPFSGKFNVRIERAMHRGLVLDAEARKTSLNEVVKRAFAAYLEQVAVRVDDDRMDGAGPEQAVSTADNENVPMVLDTRPSKPKVKTTSGAAKAVRPRSRS